MAFSEVTIICKDDERTYRHKFQAYEDYTMSPDDPLLKTFIEETRKEFGAVPEEITVKTTMSLQ